MAENQKTYGLPNLSNLLSMGLESAIDLGLGTGKSIYGGASDITGILNELLGGPKSTSDFFRQKASDLYLTTQVNRIAKKELQEQLDQITKLDPTVDVSGIKIVRMRELMHDALAKKYSEEFANKTDEELQAIKEAEFPGLDLSLEDFKTYLVAKKRSRNSRN